MIQPSTAFTADIAASRDIATAEHRPDRVVVTMDNGNVHHLPVRQYAQHAHRHRLQTIDVAWSGVKVLGNFLFWAFCLYVCLYTLWLIQK